MRQLFANILVLMLLSQVSFAQDSKQVQGNETLKTTKRANSNSLRVESGTEEVIEETTEIRDGKKVRTIRKSTSNSQYDESLQEPQRKKAMKNTVFGFGPFGRSTLGEGKLNYGFTWGKRWEVAPKAEISSSLLAVINSDGSVWNGGLGINFIPMATEVSPLIGAELGLGAASGLNGKDGGAGFSGQINAGARMFRSSETQMEVVASYTGVFGVDAPGAYGLMLKVLY
jgi:hypothetical protein